MQVSFRFPSDFSRFAQWSTRAGLLPGVLLCGAMASLAIGLAQLPWMRAQGLSALSLSLLLGLLLGNTLYPRFATAWATASGLGWSKHYLLRTGIVLYGLRLTLQDLSSMGWQGVLLDVGMLASTFSLACWLGMRWLGLDLRTTLLIGAGSSICGAAAVMATAPVAKGRAQDVAVAIATVVVCGTLATLLYPAVHTWLVTASQGSWSATHYGLWVGASVHEVAQVVAAGAAVSPQAADAAVIAKMGRVMLLAPFLLLLSAALTRWPTPHNGAEHAQDASTGGITIPWFALGFVAVVALNSTGALPRGVVQAGVLLDDVLLAMAMAALGLSTHWHAVRAAGSRPLLLAGMLMLWLVGAGAAGAYWLG